LETFLSESKGFIVGKSSTSRIDGESVSSMTSLSMPMPRPPVGGMPYSSAVRKSSSMSHASSSPAALSAACSSKRPRWSMGSLSSENQVWGTLSDIHAERSWQPPRPLGRVADAGHKVDARYVLHGVGHGHALPAGGPAST
jgi:hypothetical protein